MTVEADQVRVESRLAAGQVDCPDCRAALRPWGWARPRGVHGITGVLRPRRARCPVCLSTHVLLPVTALLRRAYDVIVEIWSDIVCPWCYIGKRRFESALAHFEHADQVEIRLRSFELDPNAPLQHPGTMAEHLAARSGSTVDQAAADLAGIDKLAAAEGLKLHLARTEKANTFAAHRLIHLGYEKDGATGAAVKEALLDACFDRLQLVSEPEVLLDVGLRAGLDHAEVASVLDGDRFADEVRADQAQAIALGCTGVPFYVFDRAFAVSGAQDSATFSMTLQRAWERSRPLIEVVVPSAKSAGGMVCTDDSCTL